MASTSGSEPVVVSASSYEATDQTTTEALKRGQKRSKSRNQRQSILDDEPEESLKMSNLIRGFFQTTTTEEFESIEPIDLLTLRNEMLEWVEQYHQTLIAIKKEHEKQTRRVERFTTALNEQEQQILGAAENEASFEQTIEEQAATIAAREQEVADLTHEIVALRRQRTSATSGSLTQGFKIPDPEIFDASATGITWPQWKDKMFNKLRSATDVTEASKLAYFHSRLKGGPAEQVRARYDPDATDAYTEVSQVFKSLESIYGDPNRKQDARRKYNSLYQRARPFAEFYADLRLYASMAHIDEHRVYADIPDKISLELSDKMVTSNHSTSPTL